MNTIIMTITDLTCRHAVSPFILVELLSTFLSLSLSLSLFSFVVCYVSLVVTLQTVEGAHAW